MILIEGNKKKEKMFAVTGVEHGSIVFAWNERMARRAFDKAWKGEFIISVKKLKTFPL